jgi:hypothetical protein
VEAREISRVLSFDRDLQLMYRELLLTKKSMDEARLEPSPVAIANIMRYAHGLEVKQ